MNIKRSYIGAALVAALATSAAAGCTSSTEADRPPAANTKGYAGEAVTLTIGTDDSPGVSSADQISYFAEQVAELSDGKITIEPRWHAEGDDHPTDWDQAVAEMVRAGELDLALGPTWAWDVLGVTSLQPLQAPFLVDSDPLVAAILRDEDLTGRLMSGMADTGVTGISMWPEGLRHPFGFERPLTKPEHYTGQVIRSAKSKAITQVFATLGAKTSAKEPNAETMAGMHGEFVLNPNGIAAGNITFFPKVNLLYAHAERYAALDDQAVRVLAEAAETTRDWAIEQTNDLTAGQAFCADGGTVVAASSSDVAALTKATAPAIEAIAKAPGNDAVIDTITGLKQDTPADATAAPCTGQEIKKHKPGKAEAALNGTYRYVVTPQDYADSGLSESDAYHNAGVQTYILQDGRIHYRLDPSEHEFGKDPAGPDETDGTYQVDGNAITFWFPAYNEMDRAFFEVAGDGDLTMTPLDFPEPQVEFLMTYKVWEKIE
jgi:TRAP-type C4-dicarboxylate transport system substrate-binding protein